MKTCGNCALKQHQGGICPVFNTERAPTDTACPHHTSVLQFCEICGQIVLPNNIVYDMTNGTHIHCLDCQMKTNTCATCSKENTCSFQTDPSPIPQLITKQIRQGNMITVTQVPNPERIAITCQKNCSCYDPENGCNKQLGLCNNWKIVYEK